MFEKAKRILSASPSSSEFSPLQNESSGSNTRRHSYGSFLASIRQTFSFSHHQVFIYH
jgi:hypothetical protein